MSASFIFKALADETRLRIVNLLNSREYNVNEIVSILGMGQSRISRHLKILTDSGILEFRRDGLWVIYTMSERNGLSGLYNEIFKLFEKEELYTTDKLAAQRYHAETLKKSAAFFDSVAEDWDLLKKEIFGAVDLGHLILSRLPQTATAADLGCGNGALLEEMLTHSGEVIGVDNSPKMLAKARAKFNGDDRVSLRIGEMEHLPLRDGEAGAAVMNMVLHHLSVPLTGIQETFRVLKPGAQFILCEFDRHENETLRSRYGDRWLGFEASEVEKWLTSTGFQFQSVEKITLSRGMTANLFLSKRL